MMPSRPLVACALAVVLAACGSAASTSPEACPDATPVDLTGPGQTGTTCPQGGTLLRYTGGTPANFGSTFTGSYCTRCHATALSGAARNGAPPHANMDDLCSIREHAALIDGYAGAAQGGSPSPVNTVMPPGAPTPSVAERQQLSEWVSCGAP